MKNLVWSFCVTPFARRYPGNPILFAWLILVRRLPLHCVKNVQIRSYFWSVFSFFRTESCIQSKYRKIRTRNNSVSVHFPGSADSQPPKSYHMKTKNLYISWPLEKSCLEKFIFTCWVTWFSLFCPAKLALLTINDFTLNG